MVDAEAKTKPYISLPVLTSSDHEYHFRCLLYVKCMEHGAEFYSWETLAC